MTGREDDIPAVVRTFIADRVGSVVQLETMLMLHREPGRAWTAEEVAGDLRIDPTWAAVQLDALCEEGLADRAGSPPQRLYRFGPRDAALRDTLDRLAKAYAERRVTVIGLIFAKPADNLKAFADAFRLRKDKPHG